MENQTTDCRGRGLFQSYQYSKAFNKTLKSLLDINGRRLRVRSINVEKIITESMIRAKRSDDGYDITITHGGDVANSYGYSAETECIAVVTCMDGRVWANAGRMPANKVTKGGIAAHLIDDDARPYYDSRYGQARRMGARQFIIDLCLG